MSAQHLRDNRPWFPAADETAVIHAVREAPATVEGAVTFVGSLRLPDGMTIPVDTRIGCGILGGSSTAGADTMVAVRAALRSAAEIVDAAARAHLA
jgi:hypothetical protein